MGSVGLHSGQRPRRGSGFRGRWRCDGPSFHHNAVLASAGPTLGGLLGFVICIFIMVWIYNIAKRNGCHARAGSSLGCFFDH